jgi:hypothetical protein
LIVHLVDIGGIVDHHFLYYLFIIEVITDSILSDFIEFLMQTSQAHEFTPFLYR